MRRTPRTARPGPGARRATLLPIRAGRQAIGPPGTRRETPGTPARRPPPGPSARRARPAPRARGSTSVATDRPASTAWARAPIEPLEDDGRHQDGRAAGAGERPHPHRVGSHGHGQEVADEGRQVVRADRRPEPERPVPAPHQEPPLPRHEKAIGGRESHDAQHEDRVGRAQAGAEVTPVDEQREQSEKGETDRETEAGTRGGRPPSAGAQAPSMNRRCHRVRLMSAQSV